MSHLFIRLIPVVIVALSVLLPGHVRAEVSGPYVWNNAVMRTTPAKIGSAYLTIENHTTQGDVLTGAKAAWADHIELHETTTTPDGVMNMHKIDGIDLPARGGLVLQGGARHLMIFGIKEEVSVGEQRDITLEFKKAGAVTVPFTVQPLAAPPMHHGMHDMPGM